LERSLQITRAKKRSFGIEQSEYEISKKFTPEPLAAALAGFRNKTRGLYMYNQSELKTLSGKDAFEPYRGRKVQVAGFGIDRMAGELTEINDHFITLTHRDGRTTTLRRNAINLISMSKVEL